MATTVKWSDSTNHTTNIKIGTLPVAITCGDNGSCYGECFYDVNIDTSGLLSSIVESDVNTNVITLTGDTFTSDKNGGYFTFTSHGKTMTINITVVAGAKEVNVEAGSAIKDKTFTDVCPNSNYTITGTFIYYEGKDSDGNWIQSTASNATLTTKTLEYTINGTTKTIIGTQNNGSVSFVVPKEDLSFAIFPLSCAITLGVTDGSNKENTCTSNIILDNTYASVKFSFAQSTYNVKFSGSGQTTTIILNIENWGGVTPDNYNTWGTNGNHLLITSSTGALAIRSKTYSSSGSFSIVVALGGNANITGDIICKDIVCSGEARCTINATYAFNVSISYNSSDIKSISISGSLAGSSFGLSLSQKSTSTTVSPGLYNLTLNRCDLTVNATFGGDTLGLFCNNSSVMENKVFVADIGNISGTSFNISSNFTYSFNVTNYSLAFEIAPYHKPTGKIMFNYTTTGNDSAFRVVVWLESTKNGIEDVANVLIYSSENNISNKNIYNFEPQYTDGFSNVKVQVVGSANNGNNNITMNVSSSGSAKGYTSSKNLSSYNYDYTFDTGLAGYSASTITISMRAGA